MGALACILHHVLHSDYILFVGEFLKQNGYSFDRSRSVKFVIHPRSFAFVSYELAEPDIINNLIVISFSSFSYTRFVGGHELAAKIFLLAESFQLSFRFSSFSCITVLCAFARLL